MSIRVKPNALAGKNVIVTGDIAGLTRPEAQKVLEDAGAKYEKSFNNKVNLVVIGEKAGGKKLEKIQEKGTETTSWDDLLAKIQADGDGDDDDDAEMDDQEPEAEPKPKAAAQSPSPKAAASSGSGSDITIKDKTVIVTGTVAGHDRKSANGLLQNAGAKIAKSLNKSVELAVLGTNAGPDKLTKIEELGIATVKWDELAKQLGLPAADEAEDSDEDLPPVNYVAAPSDISGKNVLISGTVQGHTRASAQKLLVDAGAKAAKSLNKQVELVVLGTNPGPDKMKTIAELGVDTVSWEDLAKSLGLPEGGEPPKKKSKK